MKNLKLFSMLMLSIVIPAKSKVESLKICGNGITVDISRDYYDADPTVIQSELNILEFEGGFGTSKLIRFYLLAQMDWISGLLYLWFGM